MNLELIENKIKELRIAIENSDNEKAHGIYDEIIHILAHENPSNESVLDEIEEIVKDVAFWYA